MSNLSKTKSLLIQFPVGRVEIRQSRFRDFRLEINFEFRLHVTVTRKETKKGLSGLFGIRKSFYRLTKGKCDCLPRKAQRSLNK